MDIGINLQERTFDSAMEEHFKYDGQLLITWDRFGELCVDLGKKINEQYQPDIIVGVVKAGALPGVVLSSMFRKDFYTIKISRRKDDRIVHARPILFVPINDSVYGKKVLVVDEISLTGQTLEIAKREILNKQAKEVRTATLFVHSNGFKPDWYALESNSLIVKPWDQFILDSSGKLDFHPEYIKKD
jgi:uncharacterized protein